MRNAIVELNTNHICPVCLLQSSVSLYRTLISTRAAPLHCERCGNFDIALESFTIIGDVDDDVRPRIAGWISDQNRMGAIPLVTPDALTHISQMRPLPFSEKARRLLVYAAQVTSDLGQSIRILEPPIAARVQTFDEDQIRYIADYLEGRGWLKMTQQGPVLYAITGDGLIKAEEWQIAEAKSGQGFVAMWFDAALTDAWLNGFSKGIEDAGYTALRIDNKEHANKICDEVLVEIRRSRFVVADFTGQRNGVYYEAGFAAGLPVRVIWTCRKDDLPNLHFDIRQYNCIDWQEPDDLRGRLRNRIIALIGEGPSKLSA